MRKLKLWVLLSLVAMVMVFCHSDVTLGNANVGHDYTVSVDSK